MYLQIRVSIDSSLSKVSSSTAFITWATVDLKEPPENSLFCGASKDIYSG